MKSTLILVSGLAIGIVMPAHAQLGPSSVVRCESDDGRTRECAVGYARDARLVRQLSRSPCIEGETWGLTRRSLWVTRGCRGEFVIDDRGRGHDDYGPGDVHHIRCESSDGRSNRCAAPRGRVELVRQLSRSACVRGQSWGSDGRGIWVSGGCRAEFRVEPRGDYGYGSPAHRFVCESTNGAPRHCTDGMRGRIQLVRQVSRAPCVEGNSWGRERDGVWVAQGCRAEFEVSGRGWRDD